MMNTFDRVERDEFGDMAYYDDTIDEWVAVSELTGREYFGQTYSEAEYNRAEDERVYGDHHRKAVVQ